MTVLQNILDSTPGLVAIIVSDKDGVPITKAIADEQTDVNKRNLYTGPFTSVSEQASKLGLGKNKSLVCYYDKYQVVSVNRENIHYHFIGKPDGNTGHFLNLDKKLDEHLDVFRDMFSGTRNSHD